MDCHALKGCPVCSGQLAGVAVGTVGDALYAHLRSLPANAVHDHTQDPAGSIYNPATTSTQEV